MYKIYTDLENVPQALISGLFHCHDVYEFTSQACIADFFAFPCHYQVAYEYSDYEYSMHGLDVSIKPLLVEKFEAIKALSRQFGKPIICFYLRDGVQPIPVDNLIVFRSSLLRTKRGKNEFAYPANGRPLLTPGNRQYDEFLPWTGIPSVGFVGQSVELRMPVKTALQYKANNILNALGAPIVFNLKYNFGYLQRRNAILELSANNKLQFDYRISTNIDYFKENSRFFYSENLLTHQYALTSSGHGNYSYRFYEIMEAGRIPLFINTDCVLPLEEWIDYKNMVVWIEPSSLPSIAEKLFEFHIKHQGRGFIDKQREIKSTWQNYLQGDNFYRHIPNYLRHF